MTGHIFSAIAAVLSKNNSYQMSGNAEILLQFALGCSYITSIVWLYIIFLRCSRHEIVARIMRIMKAIAYITTAYGILARHGHAFARGIQDLGHCLCLCYIAYLP